MTDLNRACLTAMDAALALRRGLLGISPRADALSTSVFRLPVPLGDVFVGSLLNPSRSRRSKPDENLNLARAR
jgi:hypothetical protein